MRFTLGLLVFLLLCTNPALHAQNAADQAALNDLKIASRQMDLEAEGVPAFRLIATLQSSDYRGKPEAETKWTEEFAQTDRRRRTFRSDSFVGPDAKTPHFFLQRFLMQSMLHPGPPPELLENSVVSFMQQTVGPLKLRCVVLTPRAQVEGPGAPQPPPPVYCLSETAPIIRLAQVEYGLILAYNDLERFNGHVIAKQISVQEQGHDRGHLRVESFKAAPDLLQADLPRIVPEETHVVVVSKEVADAEGKVTAGSIVKKVDPIYPEQARRRRVSGAVYLHAIIDKQGTIGWLEVISAPEEDLAESALHAVKQWRYKPYLRDGQAEDVDTVVTVLFQFR